jgi:hypothetical protein
MAAIQARFEVAIPELPDHIDPASYSEFNSNFLSADRTRGSRVNQ